MYVICELFVLKKLAQHQKSAWNYIPLIYCKLKHLRMKKKTGTRETNHSSTFHSEKEVHTVSSVHTAMMSNVQSDANMWLWVWRDFKKSSPATICIVQAGSSITNVAC